MENQQKNVNDHNVQDEPSVCVLDRNALIESSKQTLAQSSAEYTSYFDMGEWNSEVLNETSVQIESSLNKLDELGEHLDYVQITTSNIKELIIPQLYQQSNQLKTLYKKIDCVQQYVRYVNQKSLEMEKQVQKLEKQQTQERILKFVPSFFKRKQTPATNDNHQNKISFDPQKYKTNRQLLFNELKNIEVSCGMRDGNVENANTSEQIHSNVSPNDLNVKEEFEPNTTTQESIPTADSSETFNDTQVEDIAIETVEKKRSNADSPLNTGDEDTNIQQKKNDEKKKKSKNATKKNDKKKKKKKKIIEITEIVTSENK